MIAKRISLRAFIEGIEIPIIGVNLQATVSNPASCTMQVVPLDEVHNIKAKSMVHVFYWDFNKGDIKFDDLENYKIIFSGEIIGVEFQKTPNGRSAILQCADFTVDWDICYQYMITYGPNGNVLTPEGANYGAGGSMFDNIINGHSGVLLSYLRRRPKSPGLQGITGLMGGIISFIEAFGGISKHSAGVNDYFAICELKHKILQQVIAEQNDDTARRLFDEKHFMEWLERGVTTLGELCRLTDMIRLLFKYIYYEYVTNFTPMYVPGSGQNISLNKTLKINHVIEGTINRLFDDQNIDNIKERVLVEYEQLKSASSIGDNKKQVDSINQAMQILERIKDITQYSKNVVDLLNSAKKYLKDGIISSGAPKDIKLDRLNTYIFKPECYFVAPPRCNIIFPGQVTQFSYSRNFLREVTRLRLQTGMAFIGNERLLADFSYAPSIQEIKVLANDQKVHGVRALLPWEKFTGIQPKFETLHELNYVANKRQKQLQKGVVRGYQSGTNKKTGEDNIVKMAVSMKQKAANFNFFKARFESRQINLNMKFNPYLILGFPCAVIDKPFYIRDNEIKILAEKQGFKLEDVKDFDIVKDIDKFSELLPAPIQYLGYISLLSHSIDQTGGTTNAVLTHARTHRVTNDDFLKFFLYKQIEVNSTQLVKTFLDYDDLEKQGNKHLIEILTNLTFQGSPAEITSNDKETRNRIQIDSFDLLNTKLTKKLTESTSIGKTQSVVSGNVTYQIPSQYGLLKPGGKGIKGGIIKEIIVTDPSLIDLNGKKCWRSVVLYEEKKGNKEYKNIPVEELIRPNWFSPLYSNLDIGKNIYTPFLGTDSLVDQIIFTSTEGSSVQGLSDMDKVAYLRDLETGANSLWLPDPKLYDTPSVQTAVDILAFQYAQLLDRGGNVDQFIENYTSRPIASMRDIFGSADLEYQRVGNQLDIKTGVPGFHSSSVAPFGELIGLIDNPDIEYASRFGDKSTEKISRTNDVRPERRASIDSYTETLRREESLIGLVG